MEIEGGVEDERGQLERTMGFEPTTFCLASRRSTPELRPLRVHG